MTPETPGLRPLRLPTADVDSIDITLSALNVDLSALTNNNLKVPQAWGLAIQQHPAAFEAIQFKSRFNDWFCLAVFNRGEIEKQITETRIESLLAHLPAIDWLHEHK